MATPIKATPYGRDTSCTDRLRPGRLVSGATLLAEAAYRRLTTPRGSLIDDPDYGLNVSQWLSKDVTDEFVAAIPGMIRTELTKDDRLDALTLVITPTKTVSDSGAIELDIEIRAIGAEEESFTLVLHVSDVTVEILRLEGGANG